VLTVDLPVFIVLLFLARVAALVSHSLYEYRCFVSYAGWRDGR